MATKFASPVSEREGRRQVRHVIDQRALAQQHTLRSPRGARAVDHQGSVVVADLRVVGRGRRRGEQGFVLVLVTAHHDDAVQARDFGADRLDGGLQLLADKKHAGAAVVEHVDEFVADDPPIDDRWPPRRSRRRRTGPPGRPGGSCPGTPRTAPLQAGGRSAPAARGSAPPSAPRTTAVRRIESRCRRAGVAHGARPSRRASRPCPWSRRLVA